VRVFWQLLVLLLLLAIAWASPVIFSGPPIATMRIASGPSRRGGRGPLGPSLLSLALCLLLTLFPISASAKAILGVDLGSLYMKVALVQRNSPLEIVTNLHSKRKTEQMVLFDQDTRFYGADANSMAARKPAKIADGVSVLLGRGDDHPTVKVGLPVLAVTGVDDVLYV